MAYDFKNLNEIPTQDKPTENTTVVAFESGNPRQIPAGAFGGNGLVVDLRSYHLSSGGEPTTISDISYDPIYEAIMTGQHVEFRIIIQEMGAFIVPVVSCVMGGVDEGLPLSTYSDFVKSHTNQLPFSPTIGE